MDEKKEIKKMIDGINNKQVLRYISIIIRDILAEEIINKELKELRE